jgi:hypothetical protein
LARLDTGSPSRRLQNPVQNQSIRRAEKNREESEFAVINLFETLDVVRKFAGPNAEVGALLRVNLGQKKRLAAAAAESGCGSVGQAGTSKKGTGELLGAGLGPFWAAALSREVLPTTGNLSAVTTALLTPAIEVAFEAPASRLAASVRMTR